MVGSFASSCRASATSWTCDGATIATIGPFYGRRWLNTAHQGPCPRFAQDALREALAMKVRPAQLRDEMFWDVPRQLRQALARLTSAESDEIALCVDSDRGLSKSESSINGSIPCANWSSCKTTRKGKPDFRGFCRAL
jgi:hypothetical protein